jgi:hypothetical protein
MNTPASKSTRSQTRKSPGKSPGTTVSEPVPEETPSPARANGRSPRGTVVFRFEASAADRVKLVADFTGWEKQPLDLRRDEDGTWQIAVELPPGQYSYRFLVDNEWRDDPRCPDYEPNPFGGLNAVLRIM